jgi:hypothetical protein
MSQPAAQGQQPMDALKIALETVFVGVLALPWLALAAQLFFPEFSLPKLTAPDGWLAKVQSIKSETVGYAVVGLLSVAMAYTLGAAISRLAEDFFNDDDLYITFIPTEDQIRASVYRRSLENALVKVEVPVEGNNRDDKDTISAQGNSGTNREETQPWFRGRGAHEEISASDRTRQTFGIQEATLLLEGEDKVSRIRLLHQQLNVLRGAAFDGILTCLLFLLGWNANKSSGLRHSKWVRTILPASLLGYAVHALLWNHFKLFPDPQAFWLKFDDPPFMELTLILLCAGGLYVAWNGTKGAWPQGTGLVAFLLTALAYCGWYWTEIRYDQLIIYSFYAGQHPLTKLTQ